MKLTPKLGIAEDAAHWIVKSQKIVGVGVDTASLDYGLSTTFPTHRILYENNIYGIENLNIPPNLPGDYYTLRSF